MYCYFTISSQFIPVSCVRSLPTDQVDYNDDKSILLEAIKSLSDLITQTAEATNVSVVHITRVLKYCCMHSLNEQVT